MAEATLFAVKTCRRFQEERLPFIKETWAKAARHLIYVGDDTDETLGVIFTNIFHQHFSPTFFTNIFCIKVLCKSFCTYILGLNFFVAGILAQMRI
jgi:hypothetical protein